MKYSKEIKTGLLAVVAIALCIWGYNYLKGSNLLFQRKVLYAVYDRVDGLVESNPVTINGYKIGQVAQMEFLPGKSGRVVVSMIIRDKEFFIPRNSVARIISSDILGSKAIELSLGDQKVPALNGDTLIDDIQASFTDEVSKTVMPIKVKAESMFQSLDSVLTVIKQVFNEETRKELSRSIGNISTTIKNFEHTSSTLDTMMTEQKGRLTRIFANIESISTNLKNNNEKLTHILANVASISDSLAKADLKTTINNANKAIGETADIMSKINKGEGTMGMLVNNDSLYNNLNDASKNLDRLMEDMRKNPGRYIHISVFGKKDKSQ